MNSLKSIISASAKVIRTNTPAILTGIGIGGTIVTAGLSVKAGYKVAKRLSEVPPKNTPMEILEETWDLFIPPMSAGVITVGAILLSSRVSSRRAAAAYSVLAVSERAFEEYRDKVVEILGEKKEQAVRDDIAQDRINKAPPTIIVGEGSILCCEFHTGRYFQSDIETLRRAENKINAMAFRELYATLDDFYEFIDIPGTETSGNLGWDSDKLLTLEFSSVLTPDNKPCLAFSYNYLKPV